MEDLTQLLTEVVAGDEDDGEPSGRPGHAVISGQDRSVLGTSVSYQAASAEVRTVRGILPDQPQPRREATEHRVYSEPGTTHLVPAHKISGT